MNHPIIAAFAVASCLSFCPTVDADDPTRQVGFSSVRPESGPFVAVDGGFMVAYDQRIPGTDIQFRMIPIPGGQFQIGSPPNEAAREPNEGPQVPVEVRPMWVAQTEVDWQLYTQYMNLHELFQRLSSEHQRPVDDSNRVDAVTAPTPLYDPSFTYGFGDEPDQPAVTMTRYAAQQFSKWLSLLTNAQYRLPTEAEWEYAARSGTTTAYSWGDDPEEAGEFAWYYDNSEDGPTTIGSKPPNLFGLQDMHGSVAEWTVNTFTNDGYAAWDSKTPVNATEFVVWPEEPTRYVVRGGSWQSDASAIRSAARMATDGDQWKLEDPNLPLSPWWFTDDPTRGIGLRLFRSYQPLSQDEIAKFWGPNESEIRETVEFKVADGRSYYGLVDPELPIAAQQ